MTSKPAHCGSNRLVSIVIYSLDCPAGEADLCVSSLELSRSAGEPVRFKMTHTVAVSAADLIVDMLLSKRSSNIAHSVQFTMTIA